MLCTGYGGGSQLSSQQLGGRNIKVLKFQGQNSLQRPYLKTKLSCWQSLLYISSCTLISRVCLKKQNKKRCLQCNPTKKMWAYRFFTLESEFLAFSKPIKDLLLAQGVLFPF